MRGESTILRAHLASWALAALLVGGCGEREVGDISELAGLTPSVCVDFCEAYLDCMYSVEQMDGWYADVYTETGLAECEIDCGLALTEGTVVYDAPEVVEVIEGDQLEDYLNCLVQSELMECSYRYSEIMGHSYASYRPDVSEHDACDTMADCWSMLDSELLPTIVWTTNLFGEQVCDFEYSGGDTQLHFFYDLNIY